MRGRTVIFDGHGVHGFGGRSVRHIVLGLGVVLGGWPVVWSESAEPHRRAVAPAFERRQVERVFFDNVLERVVGERPGRGGQAPLGAKVAPALASPGSLSASGLMWSQIVSSGTLEDEIKSLKQPLDQVVTTPASFAAAGHRTARRAFTLLASLFAVMAEYDGPVRWKDEAAGLRDRCHRAAVNLRAGGAIQAYQESKLTKQLLEDLIRGTKVSTEPAGDFSWSATVDRIVIMQLLETRFEPNLKRGTAGEAELKRDAESIQREAELVAVLAALLVQEGVEDADDEAYRKLARQLGDGATRTAKAAAVQETAAAQQGLADLRHSCTACHDEFR